MSRLDWKRGRWTATQETLEIHGALYGWQHNFGDEIEYYRFLSEDSYTNTIYDEGDRVGKVYAPVLYVPCLHVTHSDGIKEQNDTGLYFNDGLYITCSFSQFTRVGLTYVDLDHQQYLNDRLVYDRKVFGVESIYVLGQIQERDIIVSIEASQVKPDELVNDSQWAAYANLPAGN